MHVAKATISEYLRMRDYYRLVTNFKPDGGVTVEHTGFKIEEGSTIIDG